MKKQTTETNDDRIALTPPAATHVGPLAICDEAELRRRNAIANQRRAERERRPPPVQALAALLALLTLLALVGCAGPLQVPTPEPSPRPTMPAPAQAAQAPTREAPARIARTMEAWWSPGGQHVLVLRPEPLVVVGRCHQPALAQVAMPEGQSVWVPVNAVPAADLAAAPYAPGDCAPPAPAPPARPYVAPVAPAVVAAPAPEPTTISPAPARPAPGGCGARGVARCAP